MIMALYKILNNIIINDNFKFLTSIGLTMNDLMRLKYAKMSWMIETGSSRHQTQISGNPAWCNNDITSRCFYVDQH